MLSVIPPMPINMFISNWKKYKRQGMSRTPSTPWSPWG